MAKRKQKFPGSDLTIEQRRALLMVKIKDAIEKMGVFIMCVFASEDKPQFAYSIGLIQTFEMPEIIVFGNMNCANLAGMIETVVMNLRKGTRYEAGQAYDGILPGLPVYFGEITGTHYLDDNFGHAQMYYRQETFPAMQLICPDTKGKFPWQEGCEEKFKDAQPILFEVTQ